MGLAFLVDLDLFFLEHPQIFWVDPFEMYCEQVECRSISSQPFTKALSQEGRSGDSCRDVVYY